MRERRASAEARRHVPTNAGVLRIRLAVFVEVAARLRIAEIVTARARVVILTRVHAALTSAAAPILHATGVCAADGADSRADRCALSSVAAASVVADHRAGDAAEHRACGRAAFNIARFGAGGGEQ